MSHGTVCVFNHFQQLQTLVDIGVSEAVSSVDVSVPGGEVMVVGFANGSFALWDLDNEKVLKLVEGSKRGSPHSDPVIVSHFLPETTTVITIDTAGKVYKTAFTNQMVRWRNKTDEVFDGSLGRITAAQILLPSTARGPTNEKFITAMCSKDQVFVMSLEPTVDIFFKLKRPPGVRDGALPYLSWRPDLRRGNNTFKQNADPMLVVAWGNQILLLQAMLTWLSMGYEDDAKIKLLPKGNYEAAREIQAVTWLNAQVFVFVDDEGEMRVFDPSTLTIMETTEIRSLGLVFHSYFTESGSDEAAFHHSIAFCDEKIYLLGVQQVSTVRNFSWTERIALDVEEGRWEDALSLGLDFFEGKAKTAEGLPQEHDQLRRVVGDHMTEVVYTYLAKMLTTAPSNTNVAEAHYRKACGVCIDYCIVIGREEMLFNEVYPKFCDAQKQDVFLELLEPFMLADYLRQLQPELLQAFVQHYQRRGWLSRVEQCIIHMDILVIDFQQVAKLCRENELYSGLIYIYNAGCDDYTGPAEELLDKISAVNSVKWRLLRYIHDCFCRTGDCRRIPKFSYAAAVKDLRAYLFTAAKPGESLRVLRLLLQDMPGTMAVIAPVFDGRCAALEAKYAPMVVEHREFARLEALDAGDEPPQYVNKDYITTQECFQVLSQIMTTKDVDPWSEWSDIASLEAKCQFTAEQLASFYLSAVMWAHVECPEGEDRIELDENIAPRLLMCLIVAPASVFAKKISAAKRAAMAFRLLKHSKNVLDTRKVLDVLDHVENCQFAQVPLGRVFGYLYEQLNDYKMLVVAMLRNTGDATQVFAHLEQLLSVDPGDGDQVAWQQRKAGVQEAVLQHMRELVKMDSEAAASLIARHLKEHSISMIEELASDPQLQFSFLSSVIEVDRAETSSSGLSSDLNELYVSLLCKFNPDGVCLFLMGTDAYRLDHCLRLCEQNKVVDATSFLLERGGDPRGALELLMSTLPEKMKPLREAALGLKDVHVRTDSGSATSAEDSLDTRLTTAAKPMVTSLDAAVGLCQRNSARLRGQDEEENESLWFEMLDKYASMKDELSEVLGPTEDFSDKISDVNSAKQHWRMAKTRSSAQFFDVVAHVQSFLMRQLQRLLNSMSGHVQAMSLMQKLVHDHSNAELGDMLALLVDIFDSYSQDIEVLQTANELLGDDFHQNAENLNKEITGAISLCPTACVAPELNCLVSGDSLLEVARTTGESIVVIESAGNPSIESRSANISRYMSPI